MTNLEFYKEEIKEWILNSRNTGNALYYAINYVYGGTNNHLSAETTLIDWLCEEYKEPLLTDSEREYLKAVLKPFHKRIEFITKENEGSDKETINFEYDTKFESRLPSFPKGAMYKNLKSYDCYTLEELGITYDD